MQVNARQAAQLCGRSLWTVSMWFRQGLPHDRCGPFPDGWYVSTDVLKQHALQQQRNYTERPIRPGPGKGHHGKPAGNPIIRKKKHDQN